MSDYNKEKIICYALLATILIAGSYLRLDGVFEYSYSAFDDFMHIFRSLEESPIASGLYGSKVTAHPPLYFMILHVALDFFRGAEEYLRLINIIPSILTILIAYWIGVIVSGRVAGLCLAFAIAFSTQLIGLSFMLRSHSIFLFFMTAAVLSFACYYSNYKYKKTYLFLYFVFSLMASLSHYSAVFVIAATGFSGFLMEFKNKKLLSIWSITHMAIMAITGFFIYRSDWTTGIDFNKERGYWSKFIEPRQDFALSEQAPLTHYDYFFSQISLVLAILGFILMAVQHKRFKHLNYALWAFIAITAIAVFRDSYPYIYSRHWVFWIPLMIIPCGVFIQYFHNKLISLKFLNTSRKKFSVVLIYMFVIVAFSPSNTKSNHTLNNIMKGYKTNKLDYMDETLNFLDKHYSYENGDVINLAYNKTTIGNLYFKKFRHLNFRNYKKKLKKGGKFTDSENRVYSIHTILYEPSKLAARIESKCLKPSLNTNSAKTWFLIKNHRLKRLNPPLKNLDAKNITYNKFKIFTLLSCTPPSTLPENREVLELLKQIENNIN